LDRTFGPGVARMFDEFTGAASRIREEDVSAAWTPAADVRETEGSIFVYVDLPGLKKDDITVSLEAGVLTIHGERPFGDGDAKDQYHRRERFFGRFSRSFRVPRNVEAGKVHAAFADGVLTLEMPKTEESRPRQIDIN
jgi:HSP20 family protein